MHALMLFCCHTSPLPTALQKRGNLPHRATRFKTFSVLETFGHNKEVTHRHMPTHGLRAPPYGVLRVGLAFDVDRHWNTELGQSLAQSDRFLSVPAAESFTQREGQFLRCTGSKGKGSYPHVTY